MSRKNRWRQQIKDEQINYLLADVERNLEEYKIALDLKEKQLSGAKKLLLSAKQSYDKTIAENRELRAAIEKTKQYYNNQYVQFLEKQKQNQYHFEKSNPKKYKKVVYQEESESEPEFEEEEESESEEVEKETIKKAPSKKRPAKSNNIFDYINKNAKWNKR